MKKLEKLKQDYAYAQSVKKQKELELNILNDYCFKLDLQLQDLKNDYRIYTIKSSFGEIGKVIREKHIDLATLLDCYIPEVLFTKTWFKGTPKEYTNEYTRDCSVVAILKVEEIK